MKRSKTIRCLAVVLGILLLAAALVKGGLAPRSTELWRSQHIFSIPDVWTLTEEAEDEAVYTYQLPELDDREQQWVLSLQSAWCSVTVLLDGETIYTYDDSARVNGTVRHLIELPPEASGKTLTLTLQGPTSMFHHTVRGYNYLGSCDEVNRRFYRDNIYALWSGGAIMLVGIVLLVCDVSMKKRMERRFMRGSTHLGVFLFITGAWVLTDAQAPQIFTNHMALVTLLCYLCFMAMPIALSLFVQEVLSVRRQILDVFSVLQGLILAACLLSYCAGWLPLYCFLIPSCTLTVIHLISILRCGMADAKKTKSRIMRKVVNGVWALFVACCLSLVAFYSDFVMGYAWIYSLGALVFTGLLAAAAIESLYMHMVNRANAQAYQRLAYVDMLTNMANRNAFIEDTKKGGLADRLAYLVFDVNHLKTVNDQYGHQAGDQLIRDAAGSIRAQFDQYGKCYRIGGDEFVVLAQNVTREEIARAVQRWEALVEQINRDRERPMEIACGYAIRTGDSLDLDELYAQADADMYVRKKDMKKK